jgi:nitrogen fixation/metabolism regulation signal transduction histidine kinase
MNENDKLYVHILLRVILLIVPAIMVGWLIASDKPVELIYIGVAIMVILIGNLANYLNATNRKISYFLESVQNDDSALSFPTEGVAPSTRHIYMALRNVNEQIQKLKIESQQKEQYFQTLLEQVATGIVTFNTKGFILHANTAAKKMLGVEVLTHISQLERVGESLHLAVSNIKPFEQKLVSVSSERGIIQLSLKASSFRVKDTDLILLSIQDIRNELDEKELDSWMKLIRVLMHEIMNSIAPITSLSESLCKFYTVDGRPARPEELSETTIGTTLRGLNVIKDQGNRLMQFVESYRKLTRLPIPDKKSFGFEEIITRIKVLYASLENSDKVKLFVAAHPDDISFYADENQISQVLINLAKNALQANENNPNGKIHITAGYNTDNRPEIKVSDNGPGIPEEILEQVFVPFFTTRENGSGIGLSLSRQIMRLHGGSLQVHSVPGKETVFTMRF